MMKDAQIPLQTAVLARLVANSYISTNSIAVLDHVPKDRATPYITIGEMTVVNDSAQGVPLQTIALVIHTWAEGPSSLQVKEMMREVVASLDNVSLTLAAPFTHISTRFVTSQVFNDPDGFTKHGVQSLRIEVQNT